MDVVLEYRKAKKWRMGSKRSFGYKRRERKRGSSVARSGSVTDYWDEGGLSASCLILGVNVRRELLDEAPGDNDKGKEDEEDEEGEDRDRAAFLSGLLFVNVLRSFECGQNLLFCLVGR